MHTRRTPQLLTGLFAAAALGWPALAHGQSPDWSATGTGGGAAPVGGPYDAEYGVGFSGGAGLYRSLMPSLGLGLRVDGGRIGVEEEAEASVGQGGLGFGAVSPALRFRPLSALGIGGSNSARGLYLELAGGPGLVEDQIEPVVAPAAGYIFDFGALGVGPTARYMQVVAGDNDTPNGEDIRIMTVGLEVSFLDEERPAPVVAAAPAALPPRATVTEPPPEPTLEEEVPPEEVQPVAGIDANDDSDGDGVVDAQDACPDQLEVMNGVNDHDGCPDMAQAQMTGDRLVIDERVFFGYDQSNLSDEGRERLDEIVQLYERSSEEGQPWSQLRISGHADERGPESYNLGLSRERADAVREYLVSRGLPAEIIEVRAYGEEQPAVPNANSPDDFRQNRRVQFEVVGGSPSSQ